MTPETDRPTRWEQEYTGQAWTDYADRFAREFADGTDLDGEARFLDAMAPRGAAILDAGCGTGRVAAGLHRRGHRVIGVDRDPGLLAMAARQYPDVRYLQADLLTVTANRLRDAGGPDSFDIVALPGNVLVFLAPGTEREVLATLSSLLVPGGRLVTGFATDRAYRVADLDANAAALGLALEHRFATWHLDPWRPDAGWAVTVLRAPAGPAPDPT